MVGDGWGRSWSKGLGLEKPADEGNVFRWQRYLTGHWGTLTKGSLIKRALLWLFIAGVVGAAVGAGVYFLAPGAAILGAAAFLAWGIAAGMAAVGTLLLGNAFATRPEAMEADTEDMQPSSKKYPRVHWAAFVFKLALSAVLLGPIMALAWPLLPGIAGTTFAAPAEAVAAFFTGLGASQFVAASLTGVLGTLAVVSGFFLLVGLGRLIRGGVRSVFDMIPDHVGRQIFGPDEPKQKDNNERMDNADQQAQVTEEINADLAKEDAQQPHGSMGPGPEEDVPGPNPANITEQLKTEAGPTTPDENHVPGLSNEPEDTKSGVDAAYAQHKNDIPCEDEEDDFRQTTSFDQSSGPKAD